METIISANERGKRMNFDKLKEVNEKLEPILLTRKDKNGKIIENKYNTVNQRVLAFRELFPEGSIETEIVEIDETRVLMRATVKDDAGRVISIGHAEERKAPKNYINETSYIENCETSAVGRALGFVGIGILGGIASKEEVEAQIEAENEKKEEAKRTALNELRVLFLNNGGEDFEAYLKKVAPDGMTNEVYVIEKTRLLKEINDKAEAKKGDKK